MRNTFGLLSAQAVSWVGALAGILFFPRVLGPEGLGVLIGAWVVGDLVRTLATLGGDNYIVKNGAREPHRIRSFVLASFVLRMTLAGALFGPIVAVVAIASQGADHVVVYSAVGVSVAAGLATAAHVAALQAQHRIGEVSVRLAAIGLAGQTCVIGGTALGGGITWIAWSGAVVACVSAVFAASRFRKNSEGALRASWTGIRDTVRESRAFASWDLAILAFRSCDVLMLSILSGAAAAGSYGFAYRLLAATGILYTLIGAALYPALVSSATNDPTWFRSALGHGTRLMIAFSIPISITTIGTAGVITSNIGGAEFENSADIILVILAIQVPFVALSTVLGSAIWSIDKQNRWALVAWGCVACNIALNTLTIPISAKVFGNAGAGAAVSTTTVQILMAFAACALLRTSMPLRTLYANLAAGTAAGASMSLVLLLSPLPTLVTVGAALGTYAAVAAATGLVRREDLRHLRLARGGSGRVIAPA